MVELVREFEHQLSSVSELGEKKRWFQRLRIDFWLFIPILALITISLTVLYSSSEANQHYMWSQLRFALLGIVLMCIIAHLPLNLWNHFSWFIYICALLLLILVLVFGDTSKGAQRWLALGALRFQPVELMKICLPIVLADYLSKNEYLPIFGKGLIVSLVLIILPSILVLKQPDLGSGILIAFSGLVVIFTAGLKWSHIIASILIFVGSIPVFWNWILYEYQKKRILVLLNPAEDKLGSGWHIIQSKIAIGSGSWEGKGWTNGTQSQLNFLPESHTDFIIAVFAEEFGFRGIIILLTIYTCLILRGLWICMKTNHIFCRLLGASITMTLIFYVFINIGMVSGILPIVGLPLPLISYGGSSMLTILCSLGILMAISKHPQKLHF